jgi:hypothetical protein
LDCELPLVPQLLGLEGYWAELTGLLSLAIAYWSEGGGGAHFSSGSPAIPHRSFEGLGGLYKLSADYATALFACRPEVLIHRLALANKQCIITASGDYFEIVIMIGSLY